MEGFNWLEVELKDNSKYLIEASAGTGKTYSLCGIFLRLLVEKRFSIEKIIVVTYTKAATQEIGQRIHLSLYELLRILKSKENNSKNEKEATIAQELFVKYKDLNKIEMIENIENAIDHFNENQIYTIHGFFQRLLKDFAFENKAFFERKVIENSDEYLNKIVKDYWRNYFYSLPGDLLLCVKEYAKENFGKPQLAKDYFISSYKTIKNNVEFRFELTKEDYENNCNSILELLKNKEEIDRNDKKAMKGIEETLKAKAKRFIVYHLFQFIQTTRKEIANIKSQERTQTYDDMIDETKLFVDELSKDLQLNILQRFEDKYEALLVDEFQDTDNAQFSVFKTLFSNKISFFIGDPKQSIYGFRGADIFTYLKAKEEIGKVGKCFDLNINYRSIKSVINGLNQIYTKNQDPFISEGRINYSKVKSSEKEVLKGTAQGLKIWNICADKLQVPNAKEIILQNMVAEICNNQANYSLKDYCVLVRKNKEAKEVKSFLEKHNIDCFTSGEQSIFETEEAKELEKILESLVFPHKESLIRSVLVTPYFSKTIKDIKEIKDEDLEEIIKKFYNYKDLATEKGFFFCINQMETEEEFKENLLQLKNGETKVVNFYHLVEILVQQELERKLSLKELLVYLSNKINNGQIEEDEDNFFKVRQTKANANKVEISSIHKSKGLEFQVVFLPFFAYASRKEPNNSTLFIDYYDEEKGKYIIDLSEDLTKSKEKHCQQERQENARLLYVALTRAKQYLVVPFAFINTYYNKGYLNPPISDLLNKGKDEIKSYITENLQELVVDKKMITLEEMEKYRILPKEAEKEAFKEEEELKFNRELKHIGYFTSFTNITRLMNKEEDYKIYKQEKQGNDEVNYEENKRENEIEEISTGRKDLPSNARIGLFFHKIFEKILQSSFKDFGELLKDQEGETLKGLINEEMQYFQIEQEFLEEIKRIIISNFFTIIDCSNEQFYLKDIEFSKFLPEIDFYFSLSEEKEVIIERIERFFKEKKISLEEKAIIIDKVNKNVGFLEGIIDVIFEKDGKFYLLDWKSNKIGEEIEDYQRETIEKVMDMNYYKVQAYLYLSALDTYLSQFYLKDYKYEEHFGGIIYSFIRGVSSSKRDCGFWIKKPEYSEIEKFKEML